MGAHRFQKAYHLALVVHRAAADDALAARPFNQLRVERVRGPQLQRVGGLQVVMAIEQHMRRRRPGGMVGGDHARQPGGPGEPRREAQPGQKVPRPGRGGQAVLRRRGTSPKSRG